MNIVHTMLGLTCLLCAGSVVFLITLSRMWHVVPSGKAMIKVGPKKSKMITEGGMFVLPLFHQIRYVDLTPFQVRAWIGDVALDDVPLTIEVVVTVQFVPGNALEALGQANPKFLDPIVEAKTRAAIRRWGGQDLLTSVSSFESDVSDELHFPFRDLKYKALDVSVTAQPVAVETIPEIPEG